MSWIFIGLLLGSSVTSQHDSREACEGRAVILREKGVAGKCHDANIGTGIITHGVCTDRNGLLKSC